MTAYYNEHDTHAAAWLRELIKAGLIAPGDVDERDMWDVVPGKLVGYDQWHFCAGIGTWSHALRCAGWPDDRQILTISLPCQSFSAAGKGEGLADSRGQLAEAFFWIAGVLRPDTILGEQVEAAIKHDWLDVVATHLENEGYAVGQIGFPACSVGAPHIRQRLYWCANKLADTDKGRCRETGKRRRVSKELPGGRSDIPLQTEKRSPTRLVADAEGRGLRIGGHEAQQGSGRHINSDGGDGSPARGNSFAREGSCKSVRFRLPPTNAGILGDSGGVGLHREDGRWHGAQFEDRQPTNGFWRNAEWIPCRDGKARPVEPGTFPLAHGATARVGRLRGYGNAIVAPQAEAFIRAYMDI